MNNICYHIKKVTLIAFTLIIMCQTNKKFISILQLINLENNRHEYQFFYSWSILVVWLECRFLDTEVDGSNPGSSMLFP